MWSGGRMLAYHECSRGPNPVHSIWRLLLYFYFFKFLPTLLKHLSQCCCNAMCIYSSIYGQYLLCIRYFSMLLQCCLNDATMLQSAQHHKYQIPDGCLMDTMLHKRCHNAATHCLHYIPLPGMQLDVGTINTDGIQSITVGASSESCFI